MSEIRLPPKWIELNLRKRECIVFISSPEDEMVCQCGRAKADHGDIIQRHHALGTWTPSIHTRASPTDAYGTMVFEGEHYPNKSHYVRLSYDTNPELVVQLMTLVWGIPMPKLVITVRGGNSNFGERLFLTPFLSEFCIPNFSPKEIPPRLGKLLQKGLIKAARTTGAWILSSGLNRGAARHVGAALALGTDRMTGMKKGRAVSIGISPWGVVESRNSLIGHNKERTYNALEHASSKFVQLNPRHSNFLLVDNGSVGKLGGESFFRKRFEKCIASYPTSPNRGCDTPIVCVVIEGGFYTLRNVGDYLHDEPPVPVVVFAGTGKTADLLALVMKRINSGADCDQIKEEIYGWMIRLYKITQSQCGILFSEVKRIVAKKNLLTIFSPSSEEEGFDVTLLASIFRSQHWTPLQQLSLTLVWDRVDIATNEVFVYGRDWCKEHLEIAMMEALVSDRLEFVHLLIEHGLNMQTFLTPLRLEALYSLERTHSKPMRNLLLEIAKSRATQRKSSDSKSIPEKNLTLHDVGVAMSHMMGHVYKSKYIGIKNSRETSEGDVEPEEDVTGFGFPQPFDDLFVWAVLTKRHNMALLLWGHGPGALAKSLVAVKLNKYLAHELETSEKTGTNLAAEFITFAEEWESLSLELLDVCFKSDAKLARQLLTMELEHWSCHTCLTLAVIANHRTLLGHPCCQILLADLWMGALNLRRHETPKIILGILIPPMALLWEYKTREELKLLPHKEKHLHGATFNQDAEDGLVDSESLRTFSRSRVSFASSIFAKKSEFLRVDEHGHKRKHHRYNHRSMQLKDEIISYDDIDEISEIDPSEAPTSRSRSRQTQSQVSRLQIHDHNFHHHHRDHHRRIPGPEDNNSVFEIQRKHEEHQSGYITLRHTLKLWNKFYEFQKAPVTNFYRHTIAYMVFLCFLGYIIMVPQEKDSANILEIYVISYLASLALDIIREFISIDAYNFSLKWQEFKSNIWVISDFLVIVFFMTGVALRFHPTKNRLFFSYGFLLYRVSSIYWNLRLYKYMGVHRFVGPKIVMMSRMFKHMAYFAMIILVVVMAFGIARESIRFPEEDPTWRNVAEAFLEPYVMMFGEVDTDALTPSCGEEGQPECPVGHWIIPLVWIIYMMVANILIVNVLIAVFNGIYAECDAIALELWMFQRFTFVMEFERKPLLPPPFIVICHVYYLIRWMIEKCIISICEPELETKSLDFDDERNMNLRNDHSLKIYLTPTEINQVFDFESDNLDCVGVGVKRYADIRGMRNNFPTALDYHSNVAPGIAGKVDYKGVSQIQHNIRDLFFEMESQRIKLDKLLAFWETTTAEAADKK